MVTIKDADNAVETVKQIVRRVHEREGVAVCLPEEVSKLVRVVVADGEIRAFVGDRRNVEALLLALLERLVQEVVTYSPELDGTDA